MSPKEAGERQAREKYPGFASEPHLLPQVWQADGGEAGWATGESCILPLFEVLPALGKGPVQLHPIYSGTGMT